MVVSSRNTSEQKNSILELLPDPLQTVVDLPSLPVAIRAMVWNNIKVMKRKLRLSSVRSAYKVEQHPSVFP